MRNNLCTLAQLGEMTLEQANTLPLDHIAALLEDVAEQKAEISRLSELLHATLAHRYSDAASAARREAGKDTGTVTLPAGEYAIKADLPAKIEWDQAGLHAAMDVVRGWGENPADYLSIVLSVPESRFKAWPDSIRSVFHPARTVSTGKPTFKVERAKRRAA